jgi:hypothetical protein
VTDTNLLIPVLVLPDGWRAWHLAGQRGGLLTRPDSLVAAGLCSVPHDGWCRLQRTLPEPIRDHGTRASIWLSWANTPLA